MAYQIAPFPMILSDFSYSCAADC